MTVLDARLTKEKLMSGFARACRKASKSKDLVEIKALYAQAEQANQLTELISCTFFMVRWACKNSHEKIALCLLEKAKENNLLQTLLEEKTSDDYCYGFHINGSECSNGYYALREACTGELLAVVEYLINELCDTRHFATELSDVIREYVGTYIVKKEYLDLNILIELLQYASTDDKKYIGSYCSSVGYQHNKYTSKDDIGDVVKTWINRNENGLSWEARFFPTLEKLNEMSVKSLVHLYTTKIIDAHCFLNDEHKHQYNRRVKIIARAMYNSNIVNPQKKEYDSSYDHTKSPKKSGFCFQLFSCCRKRQPGKRYTGTTSIKYHRLSSDN
jgi:hypothetical protein